MRRPPRPSEMRRYLVVLPLRLAHRGERSLLRADVAHHLVGHVGEEDNVEAGGDERGDDEAKLTPSQGVTRP